MVMADISTPGCQNKPPEMDVFSMDRSLFSLFIVFERFCMHFSPYAENYVILVRALFQDIRLVSMAFHIPTHYYMLLTIQEEM